MLEQAAPSAQGKRTNEERARQWWNEDKADAWRLMLERAKRIADDQTSARKDMLLFASLYTGRRLASLYHYDSDSSPQRQWDYLGHRVTWNLIAACIDTAAARIAKSRTRPRILTFGGDWKLYKSAEKMGRWLDGLWHEQKYYQRTARPVFMDAALFHGGVSKVSVARAGLDIDRVMPWEFLVDESEGRNRNPRNAYHAPVCPRDLVMEEYGKTDEMRALIRDAKQSQGATGDVIDIVEGWHVGEKGRRIIAISSGQLNSNEDWKLGRLPVSRYVYQERPAGWWGIGIAERLVGHQLEITSILTRIQQHLRRNAGGRWWSAIGSGINENDLMNVQGGHVQSTQKPEPLIVPFMPREVYEHLERLWRSGFETVGLSEQSVTGMKPSGITSGEAQREVRDTEQERFSIPSVAFDEHAVDMSDLCMGQGRIAFDGKPDAVMRAPSSRMIEEIKWRDVDMKENSYVIRTGAANLLPTTPAARMQTLSEMRERGSISREAEQALLDMPDIEGAVAPGAAQYEEAVRSVTELLDGGKYKSPDEVLAPQLAMTIAEALYLRAKPAGCPARNLGNVLRWRDDIRHRLQEEMANALPANGAPMPPAPTPAPPMPGMDPMAGLGAGVPIAA